MLLKIPIVSCLGDSCTAEQVALPFNPKHQLSALELDTWLGVPAAGSPVTSDQAGVTVSGVN